MARHTICCTQCSASVTVEADNRLHAHMVAARDYDWAVVSLEGYSEVQCPEHKDTDRGQP